MQKLINALKGKSRTINAAMLTSVVGAAIQYLPQMKNFLGDNYGFVIFGLGVVFAFLRAITDKPLADK